MIVAAGIANPFGPGFGLILDLSTLEYSGGDGLMDWAYEASSHLGQEYYLAVVVSQHNRQPVTDLIMDLQMDNLENRCFESLVEAETELVRKWTAKVGQGSA